MASAIETVESKIIDRLIGHYKLDQKNAKSIYDEAVQLDHRIATLTDLTQLNSIDNKVIFCLTSIICEYCDDKESTKIYLNALMFLLNTDDNIDAQYSGLLHLFSVTISNRLKVLVYFLKTLNNYLATKNFDSINMEDVFTSINRNIRLLNEMINENRRNGEIAIINKIKNDFNSFTNEHQVILPEDSDIDDDN